MRDRLRLIRLPLVLTVLVTATGSLTGCRKALFPSNAPRTQFEVYDRMRNRFVPLEEPDVFGVMRPALRARLSQDSL